MNKLRLLLSGDRGFVGQNLKSFLKDYEVITARGDFTSPIRVDSIFSYYRPDIVVHLAAKCGGIQANLKSPADFFTKNILMGVNILEASVKYKVRKVLQVGTVCSYPENPPVPFQEKDIWEGAPEPSNAPYGVAKRALLTAAEAYRAQHGLNVITLLPTNMYGKFDSFDENKSHVIPALIRKFLSGEPTVTIWGTGEATREFLYVDDFCAAVVAALEKYDEAQPLNIGGYEEISIGELAHLISGLTGFTGKIVFDESRPNGQPRRSLDSSLARKFLNYSPKVSLKEGLPSVINYYKEIKIARNID